MGVAVEDTAVQPLREHPVPQRLDAVGFDQPATVVLACRERFRADDLSARNMGGRGGDLDRLCRRPVDPELAHRNVRHRADLHLIERAIAVGFDREFQAVLMAKLLEASDIVLGEQVRPGAPEIPQKPLGDLRTADDPPGDNRQERKRIIAAPLLKLGAKFRGPVLCSDLIRVDERIVQRLAHEFRPHRREDRGDTFTPVQVHRFAAELVALQAESGGGRGMVGLTGRGVPDPHNNPVAACGGIPRQGAVGGAGEHHHCLRINRRAGNGIGFADGGSPALKIGFCPDTVDPVLVIGGLGKRDHPNVFVIVRAFCRFGECPGKMSAARNRCFRPGQLLHRVGSIDPRPARRRPARAVMQAKLQTKPLCLAGSVGHIAPPFVAHVRDFPKRDSLIHIEDLRPTDPDLLHRLQISGDALLCDVAVHPVPPRMRACRQRRVGEARFERILRVGGRDCSRRESDSGKTKGSIVHGI